MARIAETIHMLKGRANYMGSLRIEYFAPHIRSSCAYFSLRLTPISDYSSHQMRLLLISFRKLQLYQGYSRNKTLLQSLWAFVPR
jgi:hypothetical protein